MTNIIEASTPPVINNRFPASLPEPWLKQWNEFVRKAVSDTARRMGNGKLTLPIWFCRPALGIPPPVKVPKC